MKIKISKSQWEQMGKKAGWMKKADVGANDVDEATGITKNDMASYLRHQNSGRYNMIMNGDIVAKLMGISKEKYLSLLENYDRLLQRWPELERN